MQIITNANQFVSDRRSVVTIGKFDGIHRGHQELIKKMVSLAAEMNAVSVVFVINTSPQQLLSKEERRQMLAGMGVDVLLETMLDGAMITTKAEDFITGTLVGSLHAAGVVVGEDYHFGYERQGNVAMLQDKGREYDFKVFVLKYVSDGERISSSMIREKLAKGLVEEVNGLLGYDFYVTGEIIHGRQLGRTIGIPTANLITDQSKLLPPYGVYYTRSVISGNTYCGITNIGTKPTVDGQFTGVETYFFDCGEELYGEDLRVSLLHFARPETRFADIEALKAQIDRDKTDARAYFGLAEDPAARRHGFFKHSSGKHH